MRLFLLSSDFHLPLILFRFLSPPAVSSIRPILFFTLPNRPAFCFLIFSLSALTPFDYSFSARNCLVASHLYRAYVTSSSGLLLIIVGGHRFLSFPYFLILLARTPFFNCQLHGYNCIIIYFIERTNLVTSWQFLESSQFRVDRRFQ